jgi:ABC-type proline/glycine betaine transport system ATPase subunit
LDAVSRRLELLKLEGLGFSQVEIVKELSVKCACSKRTVYSDFETRESWQPVVQSVSDARKLLFKVVNRYEQVYRQASARKFKELSDGQKYRYKLAKLIDQGEKKVWIIDEFCASLDKVMAKIIAYLIQKVARKLGNTVIVNDTEKNGKPRAFKASQKLLNMLNALPKNAQLVFGKPIYNHMENQFCVTRKRVANKLANPRIMQIHFHTLRHWKATMEYQKTKNILHVMDLLGHRNIESTLVYTHLIDFEGDEYHSAVAKSVEEARKLLETGFEYVCQKDDIMLFRKRK